MAAITSARTQAPIRGRMLEDVVEQVLARDWTWVPFAAITLVAFALRMFDLGSRAMHHDESLHGLYSWYLYSGRGYTHDPMMHGPWLFHITALSYLLFGDSEVTFRLPLVLFATAAIFLPYFLRHELGTFGAVGASLMLAFGPTFFYFSRFGHNEAYLIFQTVLMVVGLWGYYRTRKSAYLYALAVGAALMFSTKVVIYLVGFMIVSFVVGAVAVQRLRNLEPTVLDAVKEVGWRRFGIMAAIFLGIAATLYTTFFTHLEGLCTAVASPGIGGCAGKVGMLQYWQEQQGVARGSQPFYYYLLLLPLYEIVPVALAIAAPFLARRPRTLFYWFCVWWTIFTLGIYSYAGEKMPWLVVHLALPLVFLGAMALDVPLSALRRPWGLAGRQWGIVGLVLLGIAALVAAATSGPADAANPLASQTMILRRIALLLVAISIGVLAWRVSQELTRRQALGAVAAGLMVLLIAYSLHTGWQVVYKNGDIPVEMLVYVQSAPDAPFIAREVERISNQLGLRKDMPLLLDGGYTETVNGESVPHEAVSWPYEWYFRDYRAKTYYSKTFPADFGTNKYPVILIMGTNLDPVRDQLGNYTGNKFRLNWWYPEDYKQMEVKSADGKSTDMLATLGKFGGTTWMTLTDPNLRAKLVKYILNRELMNGQLGAREMWFYVRNDLVGNGAVDLGPVAANAPAPAIATGASVQASVARVSLASSYGRPAGQPTVLKEPKGTAVDAQGRVYVADSANQNVTVFAPDGSVVRQIGSPGSGNGEFKEPWGVAIGSDGSIYVADTWNHRIQKFDAEGRFLLQWGRGVEISREPGGFYGPRDLAITPTGQVLVSDTGNKRIQVFDQQGTFIETFGTEGSGNRQFKEPVGIAVDQRGRVFVADTWNERVQVFNPDFSYLAQFRIPGWSGQGILNKPYITVTPDFQVFVTVPDRSAVYRIKDDQVTALALPQNPRLGMPIGVETDPQGRVLVVDHQNATILAYDVVDAPTVLGSGAAGAPEAPVAPGGGSTGP